MAAAKTTSLDNERRPLLPRHEGDEHSQPPTETDEEESDETRMAWARRNQWIVLAIASGACAAFNGVFAKL